MGMLMHRAGSEARCNDPSCMMRYGLLYSGYRDARYWFEAVVFLRKYMLIMASLTMRVDSFQIHFALGILIAMLHTHDVHRPYGLNIAMSKAAGVLHRFELVSLLSLIFLLWCGVFFSMD